MPVTPIARQSHWRYDVDLKNVVRIVSPTGQDYATILGKNKDERIEKASVIVRLLNKGRI